MPTRFSPALILVLVFLALTTFPPEVLCAPISVKRDSLGDEGLLSRRSAGGETAVADLASSFIKAIPVAEKSLNALTEDGEVSVRFFNFLMFPFHLVSDSNCFNLETEQPQEPGSTPPSRSEERVARWIGTKQAKGCTDQILL
ncbi:hypothetical protein F5880DRAFT_1302286 [Lentinula raphanica]|nr:hypothetical protein F5880DRAFT_1302286 [Lentinula raphanica]